MRWRPVALTLAMALAGTACSYTPAQLDVAEPALAQSTHIFASDGSLITTLIAEENRENVRLDDLPVHLRDAVLAIEDARFFSHRGVDVRAMLRAAAANAREGEVIEGGSTITQQYVKNTLLSAEQTLDRKVTEALLAIQLERRFTKERILELYLNTIYFGNGAYGVQAAAREYFGVAASALTVAQSATLAGLIRAPSAYDPYDAADEAERRRDAVINRMLELDLLDEATASAAKDEPLVLAVRPPQDRYLAAHFVEQVKRFILTDPRFGATRGERQALLFGGGLRITTTLDLGLQAKAEEAVARVRPSEPGPDAALVSIEPATGFVRALVGGRDFWSGGGQAKLDLATGGPGRPAGSSFKPLVLAAALERGVSLDRVFPAPPHIEIPLTNGPWPVDNYEGSGGGEASLRDATVRSYNTVYAQVISEVGPAEAMEMAARLGITTPLLPYHSAVLGTNDVHPIDMASAYATFANRGRRVPPAFVTRVVRSDGTVLYSHEHRQSRVLPTHVADEVTGVLRLVISDDDGTGVLARIGRPAAGKTGTGQEWRDAWFVGYTPELATSVWMGFSREGRASMVPPATPIRVSGGTWPAQIWQLFMASALAERPVTQFPTPQRPPPAAGDQAAGADASLPEVRDVLGLPAEEAEASLVRDGFVVKRRDVPSDEYPPGYVVATDPAPGSRVRGGSVVTLEVANGQPESTTVPGVLGLDERAAVSRLEAAGFVVDVVREAEPPVPGSEQRAMLVWKQTPAAGQPAETGSTVRIWVNP